MIFNWNGAIKRLIIYEEIVEVDIDFIWSNDINKMHPGKRPIPNIFPLLFYDKLPFQFKVQLTQVMT